MVNALKSKQFYNKRAKAYEVLFNKFRYAKTLQTIVKSVKIEIPDNAKILDLGCGTGLATQALIQRFPKAEITGLDYSEEMLKICHEKFHHIDLIMGDFNQEEIFHSFPAKEKVKMDPDTWDFIISTAAVSEYGDLDKAIPFVYTLLRKGGIFINIGTRKNVGGIIGSKIWKFRPLLTKDFMHVCERSGFSDVKNVHIPLRLLPNSYMKYMVKSRK
tara:strand:- start:7976 stop:8623 length:648 start_codon:yes stop_codon:yes gene_type:complete